MAITSNRNIHIGGHVTPQVFAKMKREAKKRNVTRSLLLHLILAERYGDSGEVKEAPSTAPATKPAATTA